MQQRPLLSDLSFFRTTGGNDRRIEYTLVKKAKGGETIDLFVEMACNGMFGVGLDELINPPDENRHFLLAKGSLHLNVGHDRVQTIVCGLTDLPCLVNRMDDIVEIAVPNKAAWQLYYDMQIILGMANELPNDSARGQEALYTCNQVIDNFNRQDIETSIQGCLKITHKFLSKKAAPDAHRVIAVGNW